MAVTPVACSQEYLVLESTGASGESSGAGAAGGGAESGGTDSTAGTAASGSTESGGTAPDGPEAGGSGDIGGMSAGSSGGASNGVAGFAGGEIGGTLGGPIGSACSRHGDCTLGTRCRDFSCVACEAAADACQSTCKHGFSLVKVTRNGCASCECVPPSECTSDSDCGAAERCYPGVQCEEGCSDPSCCFGNQCSPEGCGGAPAACLDFGCQDGGQCLAACDASHCECSDGAWVCEYKTGTASVASCPQACASP